MGNLSQTSAPVYEALERFRKSALYRLMYQVISAVVATRSFVSCWGKNV